MSANELSIPTLGVIGSVFSELAMDLHVDFEHLSPPEIPLKAGLLLDQYFTAIDILGEIEQHHYNRGLYIETDFESIMEQLEFEVFSKTADVDIPCAILVCVLKYLFEDSKIWWGYAKCDFRDVLSVRTHWSVINALVDVHSHLLQRAGRVSPILVEVQRQLQFPLYTVPETVESSPF